jgi:hypothetical protein
MTAELISQHIIKLTQVFNSFTRIEFAAIFANSAGIDSGDSILHRNCSNPSPAGIIQPILSSATLH